MGPGPGEGRTLGAGDAGLVLLQETAVSAVIPLEVDGLVGVVRVVVNGERNRGHEDGREGGQGDEAERKGSDGRHQDDDRDMADPCQADVGPSGRAPRARRAHLED